MRKLYTLGFYAAIPVIVMRWLLRSLRNPAYRQRLNERFGRINPPDKIASIWIHAVSVGETIAAAPLIKAIIRDYPDYAIVVTCTTPTGSAQVSKLFGDSVYHYYMPLDLPSTTRRFIQLIRPRLAIIMETELWPNLLTKLHQFRVPVLIANARLSTRSMSNYKKINSISRRMMQQLSCVAAQSQRDGEHFKTLGLPENRLNFAGNIKYDMQLPEDLSAQGQKLRQEWQSTTRPTLIAASTHEGEETIILDSFAEILAMHPNALLILVPRHPERFAKVIAICQKRNFNTTLRSSQQAVTADTQILVGDTMGELRLLYATADVAFVGGSLVPVGGHNFIEPATLGLPLLSGPLLHNFVEMSALLREASALTIIHNAKELATTVVKLFDDTSKATAMGQAALTMVNNNRGALSRHLQIIHELIHHQATQ